jgi:hypothetical protein
MLLLHDVIKLEHNVRQAQQLFDIRIVSPVSIDPRIEILDEFQKALFVPKAGAFEDYFKQFICEWQATRFGCSCTKKQTLFVVDLQTGVIGTSSLSSGNDYKPRLKD